MCPDGLLLRVFCLVDDEFRAAGLDDPDLARVHDAWPTLPSHIRAAVLALVAAAR